MFQSKTRAFVLAAGAMLGIASAASAQQTLLFADFDDQNPQGWYVNGNQMMFPGGNPDTGYYMGVPFLDFQGITLGTDTSGDPLVGNLARHGGALRISVDVFVFNLRNWWDDPMPGEWFPVSLTLRAPDGSGVYYTGRGMPDPVDGWTRFTFDIPDPTQAALPAGWGGFGDEDENYEPILPAGQTYAGVLSNVEFAAITTFRPGYFYASSWWEVGFDNLRIEVLDDTTPTCPADFNDDGEVNTGDITAFLSAWFAARAGGPANGADFDNDGTVNTGDITAFLSAWFEARAGGC